MRRLLRGRMLYIVLTVFVIGLLYYGRSIQLGTLLPSELQRMEQLKADQSWWNEDVNPQALRTAVENNPLLRVMLFLLAFFTVGMTLGGIGFALWAVVTGRAPRVWRGPFHRPPRWTLGEFCRIAMLVMLMACLLQYARVATLVLWPGWSLDEGLWVNVSMLLLHTVLLLTILTFAMGKESHPLKALGLSRDRLSRAISTGFRGYLVVFPWLLLLLFGVVALANALHVKPPFQPIHEMIFGENRPPVLGLTILLACVVGPLAEEALFRGVLYAALRQRTSRWTAMLVSGAFFSAVHTNVIGFLPILLLGCLLADQYERTGSLAGPIAIHVLHNTFLLSLALTYRWAV